jgi:hypothetical protein
MPTDPAVPVPGPATPTWTIDGVQPVWGDGHDLLEVAESAFGGYEWAREAFAALVADVRAARAHEHCVEIETYAAKLDDAGLLRSEYPDDMARRSCTCTDDAVCGAHRLLVRYQELWEQFRAANKAKREAKAAARAHEHCGPATDTLRQARELAQRLQPNGRGTVSADYGELAALLDLLVDGGGDG